MVKRLVVFWCLLFILADSVSAEKVTATTTLNRDPIGLGEKVFLTIEITYDDVSKVQVTKSVWPEGLVLLTGPTIRTFYDVEDTERPRKVRIFYSFRGDRLGRLVVSPIGISAGASEIETDPFVVGIGLWRNRAVYIPIQCRWRIREAGIITGQAVLAELMLYDMVEIPAIGEVATPRADGALVEVIDELGPFEREVVGSQTIYQLPIAAFLLTPSRTGIVVLPAVNVRVGDVDAKSDTASIRVSPLPIEASGSGAVGAFTYLAEIPSDVIEIGSEIAVSARIDGVGNLNYLSLPEPVYEGFVLAGVDEQYDFSATLDGYTGYREIRYRFVAQTAGTARIAFPSFAWVDPVDGIVVSDGVSKDIRVVAAGIEEESEDEFPYALETADEIVSHRSTFRYLDLKNYFWLLPGAIGFAILFLLKKTRIIFVTMVALCIGAGQIDSDGKIDRAIDMYTDAEYERASQLFGELLIEMPGNPGLLYNRSVAEYRAGMSIPAMHDIRLAMKRAPAVQKYREFAVWMNRRAALPDVVFPSYRLDPDLFFYLFAGFVILGTAFAITQLVKNRGSFVIASVLSIALALASIGMLAYVHAKNSRYSAIVYADETAVRNIPNSTARVRLKFSAGTSVRIIDESDGYFLVESGAGISGWIRVDRLFID